MSDPRHVRRMKLVQNLFANSFLQTEDNVPNEDAEISDIINHRDTIDGLIGKHAPKYPIDRIAKADLAILRLAIFELVVIKEEPPKVIIDEAVTLAKEFGSDRSYAFINAVLGAVYKSMTPEEPTEQPESDDNPTT